MDWKFIFGVAAGLFFGLLPYAVRDMPPEISWSGICAAILLMVWSVPWVTAKISLPAGSLVILLVSVTCGFIIHVFGAPFSPSTEDLAVTFRYNNQYRNDDIDVEYLLMNRGPSSVIVSAVGLFEIVAFGNKEDDPRSHLKLCNDPQNAEIISSVFFTRHIMGDYAQTGDKSRKSAIYDPVQMTVDGNQWQPNHPILIEAGNDKIVVARFPIEPKHLWSFNIAAWCPLIVTTDTQGRDGISMCPGFALTRIGLAPVTDVSHDQFRILPYTADACVQQPEN